MRKRKERVGGFGNVKVDIRDSMLDVRGSTFVL